MYRAMDRDQSRTWANPRAPMRGISTGSKSVMDYADPEKIIDIVFGHPVMRFIYNLFQILGCISGAVFLVTYLKKAKPCIKPKVDITINKQSTNHRWEAELWEEALLAKRRKDNGDGSNVPNVEKSEEEEGLTNEGEKPPPYTE